MRRFHVQRRARDRYEIEASLAGLRGDLAVTDVRSIRRLAARMDRERDPEMPPITAGEIMALGLIHEIGHVLIAWYEANRRPRAFDLALETLEADFGPDAGLLLDRFGDEFPPPDGESEPSRERLEELVLIRVANENEALGSLRELVDDRELAKDTRYREAIGRLDAWFGDEPAAIDGEGSIIETLRAPARHAPTSLQGQLRYIRSAWGPVLGTLLAELLDRLDIAIGILTEESRAAGLRGAPPLTARAQPPTIGATADEPEGFSSDSAWMPNVVLLAKSTYVWLDQLSREHGRDIRTLDAVPDAELDRIAGWGVTGLWLIGLWERSKASERIKRMRGNANAVASAYSLDDYRIADDLGGETAYANLRDRAWARGIRLASDMVPNHMGIDSRWVIEHPEWFLSVSSPPYPAYSFTGADLSSDERVGIVIEDHYWSDSDAAVVFKRFDRATGDERYVYHGNDGTSFPWNDTAQLDFLDAAVREQVIRTIVDVARRFPIIRFDAAMVLARRHVRRLWWPRPGAGDGIPSRAEYAISQAAFDARMPKEFWREVVDRVAQEVPGTLLLAEAFWMLEGYFVRTLGMHRVYNSAFMHMLRDEEIGAYRTLIRDTLEFDPEILKRYVNFMSNPDEATAVGQFGRDDKYFGVATVLATLPGLPMLGHGQVQGFSEKYGMEYRRATMDETSDPDLVARHEREIFPLLHRRAWFAEARDFRLFDFVTSDGVDEHVLAYSNGSGAQRSLVVFHGRFATTTGRIKASTAVAMRSPGGQRRLVHSSLAEGLGLPDDPAMFVSFRDARTGLEHLRSCHDLWRNGLELTLQAYGTHVFWEFREHRDAADRRYAKVAERLGGRGVSSLDDALRDLELEPLHAPLRALFASIEATRDLGPGIEAFLVALVAYTGVAGDPGALASRISARIEQVRAGPWSVDGPDALDRRDRAALLGWLVLAPIGGLAPGPDVTATSQAWFDELRLASPLTAGLQAAGLEADTARSVADLVPVLMRLPRPARLGPPARTADARLLDAWLADDRVGAAIGRNAWDGVDYIDRDRFASMLAWAVRLDAVEGGQRRAHSIRTKVAERMNAAAAAADYRVDRLIAILRPGPSRTPEKPRKPRSRPGSA